MASIDRDNLDEFLSAYLDDELDEPDRATLQQLIAQDSYARSRLEQLRQTVELVRTLPRRGAPPEMLDELTAMAERALLLGEPEEMVRVQRRWWSSAGPLLSAAAVLIITVGGGWYVLQKTDGPVDRTFSDAPGKVVAILDQEEKLPTSTAATGSVDAQPLGGVDAAVSSQEHPTDQFRTRGLAGSAIVGGRLDKLTKPDAPRVVLTPTEKNADLDEPAGTMLALDAKPISGVNLSNEQNKRLIDAMPLGKKLEAQLPVENLIRHQFANEINVLVVRAVDAVDERLARQQIATFAVANHLQGVVTVGADQLVSASQPLIIEGLQHRNFQEEQQSQFILRIPKDQLMGLVLAMSTNDRAGRELSLALGPFFAPNTDQTKHLVAQVQTVPSGSRGPIVTKDRARMAKRQAPGANVVPVPSKSLAADAPARSKKAKAGPYERRKTRTLANQDVGPQVQPSDTAPTNQESKAGLREAKDETDARASTDDTAASPSPLVQGLAAISKWLQPKPQAPQSESSSGAPTDVPVKPGEIVKHQRERFEQGKESRTQPPVEADQSAASQPAPQDMITLVVQIIQDQNDGQADP